MLRPYAVDTMEFIVGIVDAGDIMEFIVDIVDTTESMLLAP